MHRRMAAGIIRRSKRLSAMRTVLDGTRAPSRRNAGAENSAGSVATTTYHGASANANISTDTRTAKHRTYGKHFGRHLPAVRFRRDYVNERYDIKYTSDDNNSDSTDSGSNSDNGHTIASTSTRQALLLLPPLPRVEPCTHCRSADRGCVIKQRSREVIQSYCGRDRYERLEAAQKIQHGHGLFAKSISCGERDRRGQSFMWANSDDGFSETISANVSSTETLAANNSVALMDRREISSTRSHGDGANQYGEGPPYPTSPARINCSRAVVGWCDGDTDNNRRLYYSIKNINHYFMKKSSRESFFCGIDRGGGAGGRFCWSSILVWAQRDGGMAQRQHRMWMSQMTVPRE